MKRVILGLCLAFLYIVNGVVTIRFYAIAAITALILVLNGMGNLFIEAVAVAAVIIFLLNVINSWMINRSTYVIRSWGRYYEGPLPTQLTRTEVILSPYLEEPFDNTEEAKVVPSCSLIIATSLFILLATIGASWLLALVPRRIISGRTIVDAVLIIASVLGFLLGIKHALEIHYGSTLTRRQ
jgi:hypothetical protein